MAFENELHILKDNISRAQTLDELNYLRITNEKKYWWSSIFIVGLFYALNGDVGKMIISWILSFFTLGIYGLYIMYTSYKDQINFNNEMEFAILQRSRELNGGANTSFSQQGTNFSQQNINVAQSGELKTFDCPNCGHKLDESVKFCPGCGQKVEIPKEDVRFCTYCGTKMVGEANFCPGCGKEVLTPAVKNEDNIPETVKLDVVEEEEVVEEVSEVDVIGETEDSVESVVDEVEKK